VIHPHKTNDNGYLDVQVPLSIFLTHISHMVRISSIKINQEKMLNASIIPKGSFVSIPTINVACLLAHQEIELTIGSRVSS